MVNQALGNIIEKERQCIAITRMDNIPGEPSLLKEIFTPFIEVLQEPLWLLPIFIPLAIVLSPMQIFQSIKFHKQKKKEYEEMFEKYNNFVGHKGDKHIYNLWDGYGFDSRFVYRSDQNKRKLAACVSEWLRILYTSQHHLSADQVLALFDEQSGRQADYAAELKERKGLLVNMVDPTQVVIKRIFSSLPDYA